MPVMMITVRRDDNGEEFELQVISTVREVRGGASVRAVEDKLEDVASADGRGVQRPTRRSSSSQTNRTDRCGSFVQMCRETRTIGGTLYGAELDSCREDM
jgi:hypothetical protein